MLNEVFWWVREYDILTRWFSLSWSYQGLDRAAHPWEGVYLKLCSVIWEIQRSRTTSLECSKNRASLDSHAKIPVVSMWGNHRYLKNKQWISSKTYCDERNNDHRPGRDSPFIELRAIFLWSSYDAIRQIYKLMRVRTELRSIVRGWKCEICPSIPTPPCPKSGEG